MSKIKKTFTLTEAAEYLDIHKRKLYRMLKDGSFTAEHIQGTSPRLWHVDTLNEWLAAK